MKIALIALVVAGLLALSYLATTGLVWVGIKGYEIGFKTTTDLNVWGIGLVAFIILLLFGKVFTK